ncbi:MAG TPA: hypothetical protein VFT32_05675 [Candidatus Eisenbacteria bacterium]|nr:hypothetical protein [Candidatus Eisenbacteria bacterium]
MARPVVPLDSLRSLGASPLALVLLAAGCAAGSLLDRPGADGRTIRDEIATYPPEHRAAFALAERRCTQCHSLNEPFASHVAPGGWRALVRKMAREPGAAIPSADQEKIAAFFEYFFERRASKSK